MGPDLGERERLVGGLEGTRGTRTSEPEVVISYVALIAMAVASAVPAPEERACEGGAVDGELGNGRISRYSAVRALLGAQPRERRCARGPRRWCSRRSSGQTRAVPAHRLDVRKYAPAATR
jgi:hypothetical protein